MRPAERSKPVRIQRQRTKGWRMPPNTQYVGRPSVWGNPFEVETYGLTLSLRLYRIAIHGGWNPMLLEQRQQADALLKRNSLLARFENVTPAEWAKVDLVGKNLACWCPVYNFRTLCHADILLEIANAEN